MEGKCVSSLCVLGFCFFSNTGANPDPKLTVVGKSLMGGWMARALGAKTLLGRVFKARGTADTKAQKKEKRWFKLSESLFPHLYDGVVFPGSS